MTEQVSSGEQKLTGTDRQLQILNGIADWVRGLDQDDQTMWFLGEMQIPNTIFNKEMFRELAEIGTAQQVLDAAMQGISSVDPREITSGLDDIMN